MARSSADGIMRLDQTIRATIEQQDVTDQHTFLKILGEQGFSINQSTLSRHLRKMGIRKVQGIYREVEMDQSGQVNPNLALEVVSAPPNLLLIKTLPGHANAVGYYLESNDLPGVAGTVAGNDTLMVAVTSPDLFDVVRADIIRVFQLGDHS